MTSLHPGLPNKTLRRFLVSVVVTVGAAGVAQRPSASQEVASPRFTLKQGQLDSDSLPLSGAKLCVLGRQDICYQMPSSKNGTVVYEFGLEPRAERLQLSGGGSWIFFSAMFSGGGSGTLSRLAVLRYRPDGDGGKLVNLLPMIGMTNVSEWAMWTVPDASPYPVLVGADFNWGKNETHFSPHFFTVRVWRFDPASDRYVSAFSYTTSKKYDGGDRADVRVLAPERQEILRRLHAK